MSWDTLDVDEKHELTEAISKNYPGTSVWVGTHEAFAYEGDVNHCISPRYTVAQARALLRTQAAGEWGPPILHPPPQSVTATARLREIASVARITETHLVEALPDADDRIRLLRSTLLVCERLANEALEALGES